MTKKKEQYGKREAQLLAGIAILFMIWHHLFTYSNWRIEGISVYSIFGPHADYATWLLGRIGNICIYILAFSSGYAIWKNYAAFDSIAKRLKRIFSFLISYWLIYCAFCIYGYLFNETMPSIKNILLNLIGINTGFYYNYINVTFAWYVMYYIVIIFMAPFLRVIANYVNVYISFVIIILLYIITTYLPTINHYFTPLFATYFGLLAGRFNIINKSLHYLMSVRHGILTSFISLILILSSRAALLYIHSNVSDSIISDILTSLSEGIIALLFIIFALNLLQRLNNSVINQLLLFIGSISMYLWFIHSIFFTGSRHLQLYIYAVHEPFLIYIITLLICIPFAIGLKAISRQLTIPLNKKQL